MTEGLNPTMKPPSPWFPTTDEIELAIFGKLLEELGECSSILARCIIQGLGEKNPRTEKPNLQALLEEVADVIAGFDVLMLHLNVEPAELAARIAAKRDHLRSWHSLIREDRA